MKLYNPFKPHIVKFKDGRYGLRKYCLPMLEFEYKDLKSDNFWWHIDSTFITDCKSVSLGKVTEIKNKVEFPDHKDLGERI